MSIRKCVRFKRTSAGRRCAMYRPAGRKVARKSKVRRIRTPRGIRCARYVGRRFRFVKCR
jgi:hypothetical protein